MADDVNLYSYVGNSPVMKVDLLGLYSYYLQNKSPLVNNGKILGRYSSILNSYESLIVFNQSNRIGNDYGGINNELSSIPNRASQYYYNEIKRRDNDVKLKSFNISNSNDSDLGAGMLIKQLHEIKKELGTSSSDVNITILVHGGWFKANMSANEYALLPSLGIYKDEMGVWKKRKVTITLKSCSVGTSFKGLDGKKQNIARFLAESTASTVIASTTDIGLSNLGNNNFTESGWNPKIFKPTKKGRLFFKKGYYNSNTVNLKNEYENEFDFKISKFSN
ncbi:MAG: hypothetical protein V3575_00725 [Candidatus Absconditabacteria bacterium]